MPFTIAQHQENILLVIATFLFYCSTYKMPVIKLISNHQSRKILEQLPGRISGDRKPNWVFKTNHNIFMNKITSYDREITDYAAGCFWCNVLKLFFPLSESNFPKAYYAYLINLSKQIAQWNTKRKKATISAHTCTPTNPQAICISEMAASLSKIPGNRNQTETLHKDNLSSSSNSFLTTNWKVLGLNIHSWDFVLVHYQEKGKLYRTRWKAPTGLATYFGSSQLRYILFLELIIS